MGFLIRHRIFWDIGHFWEFKVKETKKVKKRKDQQRGENDFVFFYLQNEAGHNSEPPKQTYYLESMNRKNMFLQTTAGHNSEPL